MRADLAVLRALVVRMASHRGGTQAQFWLGLAEEGLALALGIAAPFLLKLCVDRLGQTSPMVLFALVTAFVLSWIASNLISALKLTHTTRLVDALYRGIALPLLQRHLSQAGRAGSQASGHLTGVLERLPFSLQFILDGLIWRAVPTVVQILLGLIALALSLPPRYAALLCATLLAYLLVADLGAARLSQGVEQANHAASRLSARLHDLVRNGLRVASNGTLALELAGLGAPIAERRNGQLAIARVIATASVLQTLVLATGLSLVLLIAGLEVAAHRLKLGDFVLLQAFAFRLALPLGALATTLRQSGPSLANVREALHLIGPPAAAAEMGREAAPAPIAALALKGVNFTYPEGGGVQAITLSLAPDQMVALVGANGSGKSTLARLMAGLMQPDLGQVCVGGASLDDTAPERRHSLVLYAPQFIGLFDRSLRDNGLYPPARQTETALIERLRAWRFYPDDRPIDLDGGIGEHGARLSGGQIQKLELARLCAVDAPILVLDESTSALDAASESEILRNLRARFAGRLLILVTHRPALAAAADKVVFLDAGRLAGAGRHSDLLSLPAYRRLWA